jgi:hypothetical protein
MVFTPELSALIPGWLFLYSSGSLSASVMPASSRSTCRWCRSSSLPTSALVSALVTTLLPGGGMLAGLVSAWLLPLIGWRYLPWSGCRRSCWSLDPLLVLNRCAG